MDDIPKCDICKNAPAIYDTKTIMGPHAYLCEADFQRFGCPPTTRLEKRVKMSVPKPDKIKTVAIPIWKSLESPVEIRCPYCKEPRLVEPDANYEVKCESCGHPYRVVSAI